MMKPIPHSHLGEVDLCYDAFCARITTSEKAAAIIGCGFLGAVLGGVFGTEKEDVVAGAIFRGLFGARAREGGLRNPQSAQCGVARAARLPQRRGDGPAARSFPVT